MPQSVSIGRLLGIELRIHATWLLAFGFVTWGLGSGYFRFVVPRQQGALLPFLLGALAALLLFGSVLTHELSHSLVAKARGMRVQDITLFIFGGVSNIEDDLHSARDEFFVSVVGPLTSFALAAIFWAIGQSLHAPSPTDLLLGTSVRVLRAMTPATALLAYVTSINLLLGVFNLLPAFPLDGGRVFRSILWGISRRYARATRIASYVGQLFGLLMIGLGVVRIFYGDVLGGLWTMFIGGFLLQSAGAARGPRARLEREAEMPISA
jgi:Zn-dependent protease